VQYLIRADSVKPLSPLAAPLEIKLPSKLNCARRLRIAAGIYKLIDGIDGAEDLRSGAKIAVWIWEVVCTPVS
jgi:hypothetical protein